jgi:hypothetical protein
VPGNLKIGPDLLGKKDNFSDAEIIRFQWYIDLFYLKLRCYFRSGFFFPIGIPSGSGQDGRNDAPAGIFQRLYLGYGYSGIPVCLQNIPVRVLTTGTVVYIACARYALITA